MAQETSMLMSKNELKQDLLKLAQFRKQETDVWK